MSLSQRHPDYSPRDLPFEFVSRGEIPGVGTAVADRDPESLRSSHDGVSSEAPGRGKQHKAHQIGRDRDHDAVAVSAFDEF